VKVGQQITLKMDDMNLLTSVLIFINSTVHWIVFIHSISTSTNTSTRLNTCVFVAII